MLAEKGVNLLPGHQVGRALQCQVGHAALVLVTAIPERQLAKDQRIFLGRRNWKFILWSDFHALSSLSPPSSLQWANCHPEPARGRSLGAPLVQQRRWAVHSLWSPDQNNSPHLDKCKRGNIWQPIQSCLNNTLIPSPWHGSRCACRSLLQEARSGSEAAAWRGCPGLPED